MGGRPPGAAALRLVRFKPPSAGAVRERGRVVEAVPRGWVEGDRACDALKLRRVPDGVGQSRPIDHEVPVHDPRNLLEIPDEQRGGIDLPLAEPEIVTTPAAS